MPDAIGLQEVDRYTRRHNVDEPDILANLTGMHWTFGKMRDFQGGGYGVAILTRSEPLETRTFYYHPPGGKRGECKDGPSTADYCQGAIAVKVPAPERSKPVWFITTHIGLFDMQLNEVKELVTEFVPELAADTEADGIFITGDFNSVPTSDAVKYIVSEEGGFVDTWATAGSGDGFTFDSNAPFERIDYILQKKPTGYKCTKIVVPQTLASDHLPVIAQFA